jgi:hypothetical protein
MNYLINVKWIYLASATGECRGQKIICFCWCGDHKHEDEPDSSYEFAIFPHVMLSDPTKMCRFSLNQAITHIEILIKQKRSLRDILIEFNNGDIRVKSANHLRKTFYRQQCNYNNKDIICEKGRRGYLDELPTDVWTIIKKYIIYDQN